jgi:TPP-dependent pyruvate/acetoin dehydrogenase alpha subunit
MDDKVKHDIDESAEKAKKDPFPENSEVFNDIYVNNDLCN